MAIAAGMSSSIAAGECRVAIIARPFEPWIRRSPIVKMMGIHAVQSHALRDGADLLLAAKSVIPHLKAGQFPLCHTEIDIRAFIAL
jgi:hypothetical protein